MQFWKGHALGNDYVVIESRERPSPARIRALCDRHRGVGADGVLVGDRSVDPVALRIFNPDGGEAEKSGNGLRIFGAWLHHVGAAGGGPFRVALPGETVELEVVEAAADGERTLRVAMGRASFRAGDVGYAGADPDAIVAGESLPGDGPVVQVGGAPAAVHLVSMGNPHCVVFTDRLDEDELRRVGPAIQSHPAFTRGVNVQLARVVGPAVLEILIWERGAGETLASGSSACAAAAAARRAGRLAESRIEVRMPGGDVEVTVGDDWSVTLTGTARLVCEGVLLPGALGG